ncbi:MAG: hypothetical protein AAGN46_07500 [Acidobacteriota bacterium]
MSIDQFYRRLEDDSSDELLKACRRLREVDAVPVSEEPVTTRLYWSSWL